MPESEPTGTPAASDAAGQRPTDGNDPQAQQPTTDTQASGQQSTEGQSSEEIRDPVAKAIADAEAKYRTQLRQVQRDYEALKAERDAEKRAAEEANLSELEKAQRRIAEYEAKEAQATLAAQERIVRAEVKAAAAAMGLNPALAARIVDYASIEYDDNGDPTNVNALLQEAITTYGLNTTSAASTSAVTRQAPDIGATNAARQTGPITITPSQYSDSAFRAQYMRDYGEDILAAINKGKVKIV